MRELWKRYRIEAWIVIGGILAMNAIFISEAFRQGDTVDRTAAGQFGDFVGGYVGTGVLLVSVLLLYVTLRSQRSAFQLQSFESRFFELVKIHRENVAEMRLKNTAGRRVFIKLYSELLAAAEIVRDCAKRQGIALDQLQVLRIAYYCLFYGVGENSSPMLRYALGDVDSLLVSSIDTALQNDAICDRVKSSYSLEYRPFRGHQSRLGHYYRHLYQSVRYVDQQSFELNKYEYVKTLRAQLTTHEQAFLLINSLTPVGHNWWAQELISTYRMVRNLPRHFTDQLLRLEQADLFSPNYFEWEEVVDKSAQRSQ